MLGVTFIKLRSDGQPQISEDDDAAEDVRSMQSRDGKVAREIRAVLGQKHVGVLDILLLDSRDLVRWRDIEKMGPIHRRICWIGIDGVERDLVLLHLLIGERFFIVEVAADLNPRRKPLLSEMMISKVRFILLERIFLDEGPKVLELLRPLV